MFFLVKIESDYIWDYNSYIENPVPGNGFELREYSSKNEAEKLVWEEQSELAASYERECETTCQECGYFEAGELHDACPECGSSDLDIFEDEWSEHVERHTSSIILEYDSTDPNHICHKGFEDQRPEHVAWAEEQRIKNLNHKVKRLQLEKEGCSAAIANMYNRMLEIEKELVECYKQL